MCALSYLPVELQKRTPIFYCQLGQPVTGKVMGLVWELLLLYEYILSSRSVRIVGRGWEQGRAEDKDAVQSEKRGC